MPSPSNMEYVGASAFDVPRNPPLEEGRARLCAPIRYKTYGVIRSRDPERRSRPGAYIGVGEADVLEVGV